MREEERRERRLLSLESKDGVVVDESFLGKRSGVDFQGEKTESNGRTELAKYVKGGSGGKWLLNNVFDNEDVVATWGEIERDLPLYGQGILTFVDNMVDGDLQSVTHFQVLGDVFA